MSYHRETVEFHTSKQVTIAFAAGQVWRCPTMEVWADHLILGFNADGTAAKVSRPYAYASGVGTSGPTVLLGAETYTLPLSHMETWDCVRAAPDFISR